MPSGDDFAGLAPDVAAWVREVEAGFDLEAHHRHLLLAAAWNLQRAREARAVLNANGLTFADRFRQPKERPEVAIERSALNAFRLHVRELGLDLPNPGDHRPPRVGG